MKIQYVDHRFSALVRRRIEQAEEIIAEYEAAGYQITLRQLYYQFVARDLIPNNQREYKKLGAAIADARLAGLLDWDSIADRTRGLKGNQHWDDPASILAAARDSYLEDLWLDQDYYVEVWVEKDALANVVSRAAQNRDVNWFSCRGYTSLSEMHVAAMRLQEHQRAGKTVRIIHLGDHDPSGMDMSRDIFDRIETFIGEIDVRRIALSIEQVRRYRLPHNPAKVTDSRYKKYQEEFGDKSWELDALKPEVMAKMIDDAIMEVMDTDRFAAAKKAQEKSRGIIAKFVKSCEE